MLRVILDAYLVLLLAILAFFILLIMIRAVLGPAVADRLMAVNMIGTVASMLICFLAIVLEEDWLFDVAVVYSMISFLSVVILSKVSIGVHRDNKEKAEKEEQSECR